MKVSLLFLLAACSADSSAPNFDETRSLPGPTRADCFRGTYEFEYDELDRLVSAGRYVKPELGMKELEGSRWSYDANGKVAQIMTSWPAPILGGTYVFWQLEAQPIRETLAQHLPGPGQDWKTYDPTLFAFMPLVGIRVADPIAELGVLSSRQLSTDETVLTTWRVEGNLRIAHSSANDTATYTLDDRGRIVSIIEDRGTDGTIDRTRTFEYALDRLMRTTDSEGDFEEFAYDRGGNLAQTTGPDGSTCVYSYAGW